MSQPDLSAIVARQRQYFAHGATRPVAFRVAQLKSLKQAMQTLEAEIIAALRQDLGKSEFEAYTSELGFAYEEINHTVAHLEAWAKPVAVPTPLLHQPAASHIYPQPKGVVLIIGPWNYPFQLLIAPLIGALAAGNCVVLKASELAGATVQVVRKLIAGTFSPDFVTTVEGGVSETTALLRERFDHIFFTGSIPVGKIVMHAAAEHVTPVTLELGGKSPCFVDRSADLRVAARRIVWGKFYNAGQTCVAPDYLLVERSAKAELLSAIQEAVREFFGDDPQRSPDYGRIISDRHFERLVAMLSGKIVCGGQSDRATRYLAPTVIDDCSMADQAMAEEIFGPILPVLTYDTLEEALALAQERPHPLACYLFTKRAGTERRIIDEFAFGGGCVNNALIHLANPHLPFGGIGSSGMGAYHGKDSFDLFTHRKSVVKSATWIDIKLKYPPYRNRLNLIKRLMR